MRFLRRMAKKEKGGEVTLGQMGRRLKALRKERFSNYEHFAYENELNRVQYGRYENGGDLRMSTFLKILRALGVTPEEFFSDGFK